MLDADTTCADTTCAVKGCQREAIHCPAHESRETSGHVEGELIRQRDMARDIARRLAVVVEATEHGPDSEARKALSAFKILDHMWSM